ncbi:GNAT family N-acetyltransferase [Thalassotalea sp. PS06]|uniref:GNAT family N-acetyltransferase n=1 Tax=Thalassotalea sp. PS06 TaxID=2594005 RepID=UPI001162D493|nr:GNAT family N-acetyltransferase [Thalassotalea sp. PS06]QDP02423.1 GNAT family N-acetyltransferase [Thalassotalea sp. PS06]
MSAIGTKELKVMIREAKPDDYPEMDELFRLSATRLCRNAYTEEQLEGWAGCPRPERFMENQSNGYQQYVLAREKQIIAFGILDIANSKLMALFVHPDFSGQKVGEKMMHFLLQQAKDKNLDVLALDSSLNAVNFYKRHGFSEIGRSVFTTQNGTTLESVQMTNILR